jgi:hypothetical protein
MLPRWPVGKHSIEAKQNKLAVRRTIAPRTRTSGQLHTVKILCEVNQVECIRHGIDAPSSTVKIDVDPKSLTEEQRELLAKEIYNGLRFPMNEDLKICPPTYDGLIAAIQYGLKKATRPKKEFEDQKIGYNSVPRCTNEKAIDEFDRELKEFRQHLIKAAIEKGEKSEKFRGTPEDLKELSDMARTSLKKQMQIPPESVPAAFRRTRNSPNEGT